MSDKIKNPKGGYVLKVANFDKIKDSFFWNCFYVRHFNIVISDFDLNEFIIERFREDPSTNLLSYCSTTEIIEKPLNIIYGVYENNPAVYNKLIEIDRKIDVDRIFFGRFMDGSGKTPLLKSPDFDKLKKMWERYIPFPKLTKINLNFFFIRYETTPGGLEKILHKRAIFLSFLKPYFTYPLKEIPVEEIPPEEKDNNDLKCIALNKMSGNTIKNPRGGLVLKVVNFDELKKVWNHYKPNSELTDFELNEFISRKLNNDSAFNFEDYLKLEAKAWEDFRRRYPYANKKSFSGEYFNHSYNIYYKHTPIEVLGDHPADSFYNDVKKALEPPGSFPFTLLTTNSKYPNLGTPYNKKPATILNEFEISVAADRSFLAKFRDIFKETTITFGSAAQSRRWLHGPNINYWPQQLNFAVWCATSGCGISLNEHAVSKTNSAIY